MRIHQLTYGMMMGDAVSNQVLEIDGRLRAWGYETSIFAQHVAPEMATRAQPDHEFTPYLDNANDLLIFHYSIYSPNTRLFQAAKGRRVLIYHNITPARFFRGWDAAQEMLCSAGRRLLSRLTTCALAYGDSEFNRQELVQAGFEESKTAVFPIFPPANASQNAATDTVLYNRLRQPGTANWLTVGRVVPNKAIEDIIRIFYRYNHATNPHSRLYIVGSRYISTYDKALEALVAALGLEEQVIFAGRVSDAQLKAYYQTADLYITASHHEGFCVPLVESMAFGIPILARKATAVPETLADAGVLFTDLGYEETAEMAHLMISDTTLRQQIIRKQKERLQAFDPQQIEPVLQEMLARLNV